MFANLRKTAIAASLLPFGLLFGLLFSAAALAIPKIGAMEFSTSAEGDAMETFKSSTPAIYLHADLEDVDAPVTMTTVWIARKTDAATADVNIGSVAVTAKAGAEEANFSLGRPNKGWPLGDYRVDLLINGKVSRSAQFSVKR